MKNKDNLQLLPQITALTLGSEILEHVPTILYESK